MTENENNQSNGLAIASFVLALVWFLFLLIPFISCILWILALIFGIVALCKKQTKWASILWIIISIVWAAITLVAWLFIGKFIVNNVTDFATRIEENPDVAKLMEDKEFNDKFNEILEQRLSEKYGENGENIENIEDLGGFSEILNSVLEEAKATLIDLAEEEWTDANALEMEEEIVEDVVEEPVEEVAEEVVEEVVEPVEEMTEEVVE